MSAFDITFMRVDRDEDPTLVEGFFRTVDWPVLPREGEGLEIGEELGAVTVESVGFDFDGYPTVFVGRVVLDDLQAAQLRKVGGAWARFRSADAERSPPAERESRAAEDDVRTSPRFRSSCVLGRRARGVQTRQ